MRRLSLIFLVLLFGMTAQAKEEEPSKLHAQSAVLMDADSGRVLFAKNGQQQRPNASTTKILTCILALEHGNVDDIVTVTKRAVRQPKVHLGMKEGERFYLRDLLYSLMLESHNDSAVAIAEHISGSVEEFAKLMNEKATKLGCKDTHFITPNGLDDVDEQGVHATTATDLARMMKYCIMESPQRSLFLKITQTSQRTFSNVEGTRSFSCNNHNAFLNMMDGALSGKTGFTGDAGYCYVGALRRDNRTFVVALLACGWPNHKSYKWEDTRILMNYGIDNYAYQNVFEEIEFHEIEVKGGIPRNDTLFGKSTTSVAIDTRNQDRNWQILLHKSEHVERRVELEEFLVAPIRYGKNVGKVSYYLNDEKIKEYTVIATRRVNEKNFSWLLKKVIQQYFVFS